MSIGSALTVIAGLTVGLPLLAAWETGSIAIPHNDAWSYARIAEIYGRTWHIHLWGWNRPFLLGQVVVLGPLARYITAQHLFIAAAGVVLLLSMYAILESRCGWRTGLLGAALVGVWPGFGLLTTSFMTDVPSVASALAALALVDRARMRQSLPLFVAAVAVAVWGVAVREQGLAAFVAVAVVGLVSLRRRSALSVIAAAALVCIALEAWRRGLPNADPPVIQMKPLTGLAGLTFRGYLTLAAPLLPAALLVDVRRWRWPSFLAAAAVGVVALALVHHDGAHVLLGNYFVPSVAYPQASTGAPAVLPSALWDIVIALAVLSACLLAGAVIAGWRRLDLTLGTFTALLVAGTLVETELGQALLDRYLIVFVPALVVVAVGGLRRLSLSSLVALAGVAALSAVTLLATLAYDGARWRVAAHSGLAPTTIDAGLEWVGSHADRPALHAAEGSVPGSFYLGMFPDSHVCYVVAGTGEKPGAPAGTLVQTYTYSWGLGRERLYLLRVC